MMVSMNGALASRCAASGGVEGPRSSSERGVEQEYRDQTQDREERTTPVLCLSGHAEYTPIIP